MPTIWKERPRDLDVETRLVREISIDSLLARLLVQRGIRTPYAAQRYLSPSLSHLHDPFLIPDMEKAALRIIEAIKAKEKIFVHGDYDVDGVTSTSLYIRSLQVLGADLIYKVPHRQEGYDIKPESIIWAHKEGASLVITSDCGIQAYSSVDAANKLGLTIIVTDHHEPGPKLPAAYAVVDPHREDSKYPFPDIAGVGVAFKVMQAVVRLHLPEAEEDFIDTFVDLAACGTIADVMPLIDENRVFAEFGLKAMSRTDKIGLKTLLHSAGIDMNEPLKADSVSFAVGPRINAVGRMDDAGLALDLLLTEDDFEAIGIVGKINQFNLERQKLQEEMYQEALKTIEVSQLDQHPFLVIAMPAWHHGLVGIVAGKLAETFYKPAIVLSDHDGILKGSGRSIPGYNLFDAITQIKHLTMSAGGHEGAVGLSFKKADFPTVFQTLQNHAAANISRTMMVSSIFHDGIMDPEIFQEAQINAWTCMTPFGASNAEPTFASTGFRISELKIIGKDKTHIKIGLQKNGETISCVAWSRASWKQEFSIGQVVDILYTPQLNKWNGNTTVQFVIKDMK